MKKLSGLLSGSALVIVMGLAAGCGGGGSSHGHGSGGGGGGGDNGGTVQGISTPSSVSVVTAQNADQVQ